MPARTRLANAILTMGLLMLQRGTVCRSTATIASYGGSSLRDMPRITSWYGLYSLWTRIVTWFNLRPRLFRSIARLRGLRTQRECMKERRSETAGNPHATAGQAESRLLMLPDQRQSGVIAALPAEVPPVRQFPAEHLVAAIQLKTLYAERE